MSNITFHIEKPLNVQVVNKSYNGTTSSEAEGLLRHIIVNAATATTVFDFAIQDVSGLELFSREQIDGELNEIVQMPMKGSEKIKIRNATVNDAFTIYLAIQETS